MAQQSKEKSLDLVKLLLVVYFAFRILMPRFSDFLSFSASFPSSISDEMFADVFLAFRASFSKKRLCRHLFFSSSSSQLTMCLMLL